MKRKSVIQIIDSLSVLILVCLPVLLWTFNHIDRYSKWGLFFVLLIALGLIIGLIIYKIITKNNIELKKHKTKKGYTFSYRILNTLLYF